MDSCLEKTEAYMRELKATGLEENPEAMEAVMEQQEVQNEELNVDTIGALGDQYGVRHLAVWHS
jgi:hypothetical protein